MKITIRKVKPECWINDTWLTPYCNYLVKLIEYKSGKTIMWLDNYAYDVSGTFTAPNGWEYTIKRLLSRPLKSYNAVQ